MKVQEAKESIEYLKMQLTEDLEMICFTGDELKALDMSIQALEEVEQYRALGTVEELKEAMEKQVAKKVFRQKGECYAKTIDGKEYHEQILVCPNCHRAIKRTEALDVHCKYCGQALKWGEEDD